MKSQIPTYLIVLPWSLQHKGGVNQVVKNLCYEMLKAKEFLPLVLITDWSAHKPVFEEYEGIDVVRWRVRPYHDKMSIAKRLLHKVWKIAFRYHFNKLCHIYSIKIINCHYPDPLALSLCASLKSCGIDIPVCLSFHGTDVNSISLLTHKQLAVWKNFVSSAEDVVVCSNDLGRRLNDVLQIELDYHTFYSGVNVESMLYKTINKADDQERIVLNIAKFEAQKGQITLLSAFADIVDDYEGLRLVFVGACDNELPILEKLVKQLGLTGQVDFYKNVEHSLIGEFYKKAEIFCLPSKNEAFGLVLLEAAVFKLPVVASRVGGIPELINDGINGILFETGNVSSLSESLKYLLDEPQLAKKMGSILHEQVMAKFSWNNLYLNYSTLARKVLRR